MLTERLPHRPVQRAFEEKLASAIRRYWRDRKRDNVEVEVEWHKPSSRYVLRSNLVNGAPPPQSPSRLRR